MTVVEKIRQLLALAASTTFAGERDSALTKARLLFNKHKVADARVRWELLTALGQDAGPEPSRPGVARATATEEPEGGTAWWEQAEAAEAEWFVRWQRRQQAAWAAVPQPDAGVLRGGLRDGGAAGADPRPSAALP